MSERITMQIRGGIGGLRRHEKIMTGSYVKASDVLAATDEMLEKIIKAMGKALAEAELRGRLEGIVIGLWIALAFNVAVWAFA